MPSLTDAQTVTPTHDLHVLTPTITVRGDNAEGLQPPDESTAMFKDLQPVIAKLTGRQR